MTAMSPRILSRAATLAFLDGLERDDRARTVYLTAGTSPEEGYKMPPELPELAAASATGAVVFQLPERTCLLLPPFPVAAKDTFPGINTEPLDASIRKDNTIALVLVRLGAYAIGVSRGEALIASKVGTGLVHGRHKKGGSSAHRFERHRDKQIEYFLTRACQRAREQIEPYLGSLDYAVYGGARTTVLLFQKQCAFLGKITAPLLPPLYDIPEPRQAVLQNAVSRIWSSRLYEWREG